MFPFSAISRGCLGRVRLSHIHAPRGSSVGFESWGNITAIMIEGAVSLRTIPCPYSCEYAHNSLPPLVSELIYYSWFWPTSYSIGPQLSTLTHRLRQLPYQRHKVLVHALADFEREVLRVIRVNRKRSRSAARVGRFLQRVGPR